MFRKNDHRQQSLFGPETWLSPALLTRLKTSWAQTFREEVFERIDEEIFAALYSEEKSRPNAPVNVLVGFEIIKAGFGWSDEETYEALSFDIRVRYALGIEDMGGELPFTLRTLSNFRKRVRKHALATGENLYKQVFEQVTDEQLARYQVAAGAQRLDSTQVLSNIARMNRLTLLISVLQKGMKALAEEERKVWEEKAEAYWGRRPHEIVFRIGKGEEEAHFHRLGELLAELREALSPGEEAYALVARVLQEQYREEGEGWTLRPAEEISADSLQSPHDIEATYRVKNGRKYAGGYVMQVSETCASENELQLITDIQVAPNVTEDSELFKRAITEQRARGIDVQDAYTDGGYTGPDLTTFCKEQAITHHPTNVRGGKTPADRWGWDAYEWRLEAKEVVCPQGQVGRLEPTDTKDRWMVRFPAPAQCQQCPLLSMCRVKIGPRRGAAMNPTTRNIQVAILRQGITPKKRSIRTVVESTVRSMTWHLRKDTLPVRGQIAATMYLHATAMMVNLRRIHAYLASIRSIYCPVCAFLTLWGLFLAIWKPQRGSPRLSGAFFKDQRMRDFLFPSVPIFAALSLWGVL